MLSDEIDDPERTTPDGLRARYEVELQSAIDDGDVSGVDDGVLGAIGDGEVGDVTLSEAAAVLETSPENPPADAIEAEVRDHLLLGMTTAVLDVDALAARVEADLTPREIQQKIEGRAPMTLDEYVEVKHVIEREKP